MTGQVQYLIITQCKRPLYGVSDNIETVGGEINSRCFGLVTNKEFIIGGDEFGQLFRLCLKIGWVYDKWGGIFDPIGLLDFACHDPLSLIFLSHIL